MPFTKCFCHRNTRCHNHPNQRLFKICRVWVNFSNEHLFLFHILMQQGSTKLKIGVKRSSKTGCKVLPQKCVKKTCIFVHFHLFIFTRFLCTFMEFLGLKIFFGLQPPSMVADFSWWPLIVSSYFSWLTKVAAKISN